MLKAQSDKYGNVSPNAVIKDSHIHFPSWLMEAVLEEGLVELSVGSPGQKSVTIKTWEERPDGRIAVPRNTKLKPLHRPECFFTETPAKGPLVMRDWVVVRPHQLDTLRAIAASSRTDNLIKMPCGGGKTVTALAHICRLGLKALILCPNSKLVSQWAERIEEFMEGAHVTTTGAEELGDIHLSTVHSAHKLPDVFGIVVMDEFHTLMATTWGDSAQRFSSRHRLALSATPDRGDDLDRRAEMIIGGLTHEVSVDELVAAGLYKRPKVVLLLYAGEGNIRQQFSEKADDGSIITRYSPSKTHSALAEDAGRISLIAGVVKARARIGAKSLTLFNRKTAIANLVLDLEGAGLDTGVLISGCDDDVMEKDQIVGIINLGKEGLDKKELDLLVLGSPLSKRGALIQAIGRLTRPKETDPVFVDVVDTTLPPSALVDPVLMKMGLKRQRRESTPLENSAMKRIALYRDLGLEILILDKGRMWNVPS